MSRWLGVLALAAAAVLGSSRPAHAENCWISTTPVVFGTYDVFNAAPLDSTGTIEYKCNGNATNVRISISGGSGNSFTPRRMWQSGDSLAYNLFLDAARTMIWGTGSGQSSAYVDSRPPNNQTVSVPVYARVPQGQDVSVGVYADAVVVTIDF